MKRFLLLLPIALVLLICGVQDALACRCLFTQPVDAAFAQSDVVIIARFDSRLELEPNVDASGLHRQFADVMTVEKVYKGNLREFSEIKIYEGGLCSWTISSAKPGDTFLFFTGKAGKIENFTEDMYQAHTCSRSRSLSEAAHDLEYLDNLRARLSKTRLSGTIRFLVHPQRAIPDLVLRISGSHFKRSIRTDIDGFFELWGVPPGDYKIAFEIPAAWKIGSYQASSSEPKYWYGTAPPNNTISLRVAPNKHVEVVAYLDTTR